MLYFIIALYSILAFADGTREKFVTFGSAIKLINTDHNVRLHSHDINYGSGSGQQSVTGSHQHEDANSYWIVNPTFKMESRGTYVKCGDMIRLQHMNTKKNLHSHLFPSPLSGSQEVSAFGTDGEGDSGDHWVVICSDDYWKRDEPVMLKHVDTNVYLSVSGRQYGSPISGQMEVVGTSRMSSVHWKTGEGFYFHNSDNIIKDESSHSDHWHTEL
ncbi:hypothetical protein O3M35_004604 [Rhynocoris fuscipes]|uniref:MIR domain-containing protein n=1 Tax=Rhynocoris fuscipes TaxID=488301 RepID=A0AAW1CF95_9HEMI